MNNVENLLFTIFFIPVMMAGSVIVGVISIVILNPFSVLFTVVTIFYFFLLKYLFQKPYQYLIFSLSMVFLWASLFFSYKELPDAATRSIKEPGAIGGFPFKTFDYPMGAMGGDVPPISMWPAFYINYIVWIVAAIIIGLLARKLLKDKDYLSLKRIKLAFIFSIILTLGGLGYVSVLFD